MKNSPDICTILVISPTPSSAVTTRRSDRRCSTRVDVWILAVQLRLHSSAEIFFLSKFKLILMELFLFGENWHSRILYVVTKYLDIRITKAREGWSPRGNVDQLSRKFSENSYLYAINAGVGSSPNRVRHGNDTHRREFFQTCITGSRLCNRPQRDMLAPLPRFMVRIARCIIF